MFQNIRATAAFIFLIILTTHNPIMIVINAEEWPSKLLIKESIMLLSTIVIAIAMSWFLHRVLKIKYTPPPEK
jgi:heme/copper-type cytochrome/quinol oxidase subunit 4